MRQKKLPWTVEPKEERRFHRVPAHAPAELMSTALGRVGVTVLNLSQSGCMIETRARVRAGEHLVLKFAGIGPRAVTVTWHRDEQVGMEFAELLSWSTVERIAFPAGACPAHAGPEAPASRKTC